MPIYDRLKSIREQLGITQNELATRSGINRSTIAQIESGKYKDLTISKLINISSALNISLSYLLEADQEPAEQRILFRAKERLNPQDINQISWVIYALYPKYKALLNIAHKEKTGYFLPSYNLPVESISTRNENIIHIAEKERNSLKISSEKNYQLKSVLGKYFDIYEIPFNSKDILGFVILNNSQHRPLIIINHLINPNQKRFILAHEYGHLLFDRDKISDIIELSQDSNINDPIEIRANHFAAEFLIPVKDIYLHTDKINEAGLAFLMNHYGVSRQVIVNRWFSLGLINSTQKEHFEAIKPIQLMKIYGYINDEVQYYDKQPSIMTPFSDFEKLPPEFLHLVKEAYVTGKISYKKIAEYCFIEYQEIEQFLGIKEEYWDEFEPIAD